MRAAVATIAVLLCASCTRSAPPAVEQTAEPLPETPPAAVKLAPASPATRHAAPASLITATANAVISPAGDTSISVVRFVTVRIEVTAPGAGNTAAVEFIAPGEHPYERRELSLTGASEGAEVMETSLAVAGTVIELQKLVGIWNARVYVNGLPQTSASFELTQ